MYLFFLMCVGKEFSSMKFAGFIQNFMISRNKTPCFAIGGTYGFSEEVVRRANFKVSLSKMTFPHQLERLIILEQIYRAFLLLKGNPGIMVEYDMNYD